MEEEGPIEKNLIATAVELCDQTRYLLTDSTDSAGDSDSESDASDAENVFPVTDFVQEVKVYTGYLIDLGSALNSPALEPQPEDAPGVVNLEPRSANGYHTELIKAKFPHADSTLLQHLGEASWERYQRMQKEREVNAYGGVTLAPEARSQIAKSDFQDSGIGTSLPQTPSTYAESVMSFLTSVSGGQRANIPPLPAEAKNGSPFECSACGKYIKAANNREWRQVHA